MCVYLLWVCIPFGYDLVGWDGVGKTKRKRRLGPARCIFYAPSMTSSTRADDPYLSFLSSAQHIIVTSDSTNMSSEAISLPHIHTVLLYDLFPVRSERLRSFCNDLINRKLAEKLTPDTRLRSSTDPRPRPPNELSHCLDLIQAQMASRNWIPTQPTSYSHQRHD